MNHFSIIFFILISGCTLPPSDSELFVKLSSTKQKQKIALLQKKIDRAEKEQKKIEETVEHLREEMENAELILVRRMVFDMEEKLRKFEEDPANRFKYTEQEIANLFLKEREILYRMIHADPTPASFEAQAVLDQILRLITTLSDERTKLG